MAGRKTGSTFLSAFAHCHGQQSPFPGDITFLPASLLSCVFYFSPIVPIVTHHNRHCSIVHSALCLLYSLLSMYIPNI